MDPLGNFMTEVIHFRGMSVGYDPDLEPYSPPNSDDSDNSDDDDKLPEHEWNAHKLAYYALCAERNMNSLHLACLSGQTERVLLAIVNGYDLNEPSCCRDTKSMSNLINIDIPPIDDGTPLIIAAKKDYLEIASILIEAGAKIDYSPDTWLHGDYYQTPVIQACIKGNVATLNTLIEAGADINLTNMEGESPLWLAVHHQQIEVVQICIDAGADVNMNINDGSSPLFHAVTKNYIEIARLLLKAGADVNKTCIMFGFCPNQPLNYAIINGEIEMVKLLIENNTEINKLNHEGCTALHCAYLHGKPQAVKALIAAGADISFVSHATVKRTPLDTVEYVIHVSKTEADYPQHYDVIITPDHYLVVEIFKKEFTWRRHRLLFLMRYDPHGTKSMARIAQLLLDRHDHEAQYILRTIASFM